MVERERKRKRAKEWEKTRGDWERGLFPSLPSFFPALSLALFFARAPLSERLEQARGLDILMKHSFSCLIHCIKYADGENVSKLLRSLITFSLVFFV